MKEHIVSAPLLTYAKFNEPFLLAIDVNMQGLSDVIVQYVTGNLQVVAYASSALIPHERNMNNYKL